MDMSGGPRRGSDSPNLMYLSGRRYIIWAPRQGVQTDIYLLRKDLYFQKEINLSTSLAGQAVGIKEVDDGIWLVTFMDYDLGYIDLEEKPCSLKTTPLALKCKLCLRNVL